jgi:hypothetical protein
MCKSPAISRAFFGLEVCQPEHREGSISELCMIALHGGDRCFAIAQHDRMVSKTGQKKRPTFRWAFSISNAGCLFSFRRPGIIAGIGIHVNAVI